MSDHVDLTIRDACAEVDRLNAEVIKKKVGVNSICELFGRPAVYTDIEAPQHRATQVAGRPDRYVGKPMAGVIRQILEIRHDKDIGPINTDDLYTEMLSGGWDFEGKSPEDAKRGLAVSLSKNAKVFYRLNDGLWGLKDWYPGAKAARSGKKRETNGDSPASDGATVEPDAETKADEFGEPLESDVDLLAGLKASKG